ncbi:hypothetical protein LPW11_16520 [Geomonas sp. RF6]|uniref:hypothetical protein n=1 Tax=Geomonas sp. RF6 TaxID=2897342 RepID=UPI001E40F22A|nr:hypothetical protein [Geomonas sp. RF6]UFS69492.1 hypothetical protein LPW11_16520 [Geomonas sp. RF6]
MQPIHCPSIKVHSSQLDQGTYINGFILEHQGNNYQLPGSAGDTIYVFTQSIAIYVLATNKGLGHMRLNAYMVPQPDAINGVYMHTPQEIIDHLGAEWEQLSPTEMLENLMDCLI